MMKKNKKFMLITIVGLLIVVLGTVFVLNNQDNQGAKEGNKDKKTETLKYAFNIKVDTSKLELKDVDLSKIENIHLDLSEETFIKSSDTSIRNKYIFNYPKDLEANNKSDLSISLYNANLDVTAKTVNYNIENYYNEELKNRFESQKEKIKQEYYVSEIIKNNNIDIMYAKTSSYQNNLYIETFYFIIQESDNSSIVFTINTRNYKVSDDNLSEFINHIKIDKNNAKYLYTTTSKDKKTLKLSLSQTCVNTKSENNIELQLPASLYKEEERYYNTNNITTFSIKNNKDSSIIVSSNCNYDKNILNNIGNNAKKSYSKIENYKLENIEINNNNYQILSFRYYQNGIKCEKVYIVSVNKNNGYYMVEITSMDEISEDIINSFTNIKFK